MDPYSRRVLRGSVIHEWTHGPNPTRVFLRDTGGLHALLGIVTPDDLLGHPVRGASWESLVLEKGKRRIAVECKASSAPTVTRGFWSALEDLRIDEAWVVAPIALAFPLGSGVEAVPLGDFLSRAPRR